MRPVVLLDFWGVIGIVQTPDAVAAMADRIGAPADAFSRAYWMHRGAHDAGGTARAFWERVAADLGVGLDSVALADLVEQDVRSWSGVDRAMLEVIADLRDAGVRLALLSNAPADLVAHASAVLDGLVAQLLFSCQLGFAKPDPRIYALALDTLGVPAPEVVFVDDNPGNVEAARAAGMRALHHTSVEHTRAALLSMG